AQSFGVPVLIMAYAPAESGRSSDDAFAGAHAARAATEIGASIIQTNFAGSADGVRTIVRGCPVPVVLAGGPRTVSEAALPESLSGPARLAERTFVGFDPEMIISYRAGVLRSNGETIKTDRPIAALRSILAKHDASGIPGRYVGGLVGYVSYEFVRNLDSVPAHADSPFPEFEFGLYLDGVI